MFMVAAKPLMMFLATTKSCFFWCGMCVCLSRSICKDEYTVAYIVLISAPLTF